MPKFLDSFVRVDEVCGGKRRKTSSQLRAVAFASFTEGGLKLTDNSQETHVKLSSKKTRCEFSKESLESRTINEKRGQSTSSSEVKTRREEPRTNLQHSTNRMRIPRLSFLQQINISLYQNEPASQVSSATLDTNPPRDLVDRTTHHY